MTDVATSTTSSAVIALTSRSCSVAAAAVATLGTRESFYADLGNPMGWIPSQMSEIPDFLLWVSWFQEELERVKGEARQRLLVAETGEVGSALKEIYEQERERRRRLDQRVAELTIRLEKEKRNK